MMYTTPRPLKVGEQSVREAAVIVTRVVITGTNSEPVGRTCGGLVSGYETSGRVCVVSIGGTEEWRIRGRRTVMEVWGEPIIIIGKSNENNKPCSLEER